MSLFARTGALFASTLTVVTLFGCGERSPVALERPPVNSVQIGYRGTGMEQVYNPRLLAKQAALNTAPASAEPASPDGPKASQVYQNVKVLGDLSVGEFSRHMAAITSWVAPQGGCGYCHNTANFADDGKYTKIVARRMIQMTQHLNSDWKQHVGAADGNVVEHSKAGPGVTCYTCHRGNPVPAQVWFAPADRKYAANSIMGDLGGQNYASKSTYYSSLAYDPFTPYLLEARDIRVNGNEALRMTGTAQNMHTTKQTEHTYALMMHMAGSLGVNCTYCHNTQAFQSWTNAPPARATAWYGIRMVRDLNNDYLTPLTSTFPASRLGPKGDVAKVNCGTCHQGAYKPLYGAQMAKNHPELLSLTKYVPAAAPATSGLPAPMSEAMRATLYFGVGSSSLEGAQADGMGQLINSMKANPAITATISGYHSASGELASNQLLAKNRAFSVRDSLLAAGVATERVKLDKPLQAEANLAGEDPAARRVEVTLK
jgi:photosynthetic reaction center cytochrome c subunit